MQKSKKADKKNKGKKDRSNSDAPMHHVDITTESPTSKTGGGPAQAPGARTGGGPMKEEKTTRASGGNKQRSESGDKEDSMGSGKRQDDL